MAWQTGAAGSNVYYSIDVSRMVVIVWLYYCDPNVLQL